jgi:hypothetical protein
MFFFIIGFGKRTVDFLRPAGRRRCPNCGNTAEWSVMRVRSWVTLFFIPVLPYKTEVVAICPICGYSVEEAE